jgi:hypothetical protein
MDGGWFGVLYHCGLVQVGQEMVDGKAMEA